MISTEFQIFQVNWNHQSAEVTWEQAWFDWLGRFENSVGLVYWGHSYLPPCPVPTPQDLEAAFGMLDEDRDGKLTQSEAGLVIPKSWGAPQVMDGLEWKIP